MKRSYLLHLALLVLPASVHCGGPDDAGASAAAMTNEPANRPDVRDQKGDVKACSDTTPRDSPVLVFALPDEGETPYVTLLQTATVSVRVFGYQMGYGGILDTLEAKARAGIDVRVILDGNTQRAVNDRYRIRLEAAGARVQWSDPAFSYMHAKVIVVDDREASVSTGNYALSWLERERNFVARLTDRQDLADLARLFDADWGHAPPDLTCTRLLVAPFNARERIVALVDSATRTLWIESMQLSDRAVTDAVLARAAAGVDVRVLLAAPTWIDENARVGAALVAAGVKARWMSTPGVHVKAIVVDGGRAYLGSENFSYTSLSKNREVGVVVTDPPAIATMSDTFERDWTVATDF